MLLVAPVIFLQVVGTVALAAVTVLLQEYHWEVKEDGVGYPVQVPLLAVSVFETLAVPETVGLTVATALAEFRVHLA